MERMKRERLDMLLAQFSQKRILVVGDFFLDRQLIVEQALTESSPETGLAAHQVVEVRNSPGAAGAVTNHLRAMGANALAVGMIGDDGEGFELLRGLDASGVDVDGLVIRADRFTPSFIRPMLRVRGGAVRELERLDVRNRAPLPRAVEEQIIKSLRGLLPRVHGVIVADRVLEENCGVITEDVREELAVLAQTYGEVPFVVDSPARAGQFANMLITASAGGVLRAVDASAQRRGDEVDWELDRERIESAGERLYRRNGQPVFVSLEQHSLLAFHADGPTHLPGVPAKSPGDATGADDAAVAAIVCALCAGASVPEAAEVAGLAAGAAPTASRKRMMELHRESANL